MKMIKFDCRYHFEWEQHERKWRCAISRLVYFGSHMEITIQTDEPVNAVVGKTSTGFFAYFRSCQSGTDLSSLFDININVAKISSVCFDEAKAATIAFAIKRVGHLISLPRRKRKTVKTLAGALPF